MSVEREKWEELFDKVTATIEEWRAANPEATLTEIEEAVDSRLAQVRTEVVEDLALRGRTADLTALPAEERPPCPHCGRPTVANGKQRRMLTTQHEAVIHLERSQAYCTHCQVSFFPSG